MVKHSVSVRAQQQAWNCFSSMDVAFLQSPRGLLCDQQVEGAQRLLPCPRLPENPWNSSGRLVCLKLEYAVERPYTYTFHTLPKIIQINVFIWQLQQLLYSRKYITVVKRGIRLFYDFLEQIPKRAFFLCFVFFFVFLLLFLQLLLKRKHSGDFSAKHRQTEVTDIVSETGEVCSFMQDNYFFYFLLAKSDGNFNKVKALLLQEVTLF